MSRPNILLVDDEASILKAIQRLLRKEPFEVTATVSPEEALRLLSEEPYAVVVSDQRMPTMKGTRLLEKARKISPDTVRIILTGYVDIQAAVEAINRGAVYRFVTKPWNDEELRLTVQQAASRFEMVMENKRLHALTEKQNGQLKELNRNLEQKVVQRTQKISRLNQELEESFLGSIQVMASLAEMHSPVIGSHSKRTAAHCKSLAQYMGLPEGEIFQIEVASVLHDIGKIGIPSHILRKSESALSHQGVEMLRRHVVRGEEIMQTVPNVGEAPRIVRHHHERFDGSGYPNRLKGRDIPLGSRIIAVANAYDNVLNRRSYFQETTPEKTLKFVQSRCPNEFDPEIVSVFADWLHKEGRGLRDSVEVEVNLDDVCEGMVLSRELRTARGVLLLSKDSKIKADQLDRIRNFHESDPIIDSIYVYRKSFDPSLRPGEEAQAAD